MLISIFLFIYLFNLLFFSWSSLGQIYVDNWVNVSKIDFLQNPYKIESK